MIIGAFESKSKECGITTSCIKCEDAKTIEDRISHLDECSQRNFQISLLSPENKVLIPNRTAVESLESELNDRYSQINVDDNEERTKIIISGQVINSVEGVQEIQDYIPNAHMLIHKELPSEKKTIKIISIPNAEINPRFRSLRLNLSSQNIWDENEYERLCVELMRFTSPHEKSEKASHPFTVGKAAVNFARFIAANVNDPQNEAEKDFLRELHYGINSTGNFINQIYYGGIGHDFGKALMPQWVLNKNGPLTPKEFELIKRHAWFGAYMLHGIPGLEVAAEIAHYHHTYPDRKKSYNNPFNPVEFIDLDSEICNVKQKYMVASTIVTLADIYDALLTDRPYRKKVSKEGLFARFNGDDLDDPKGHLKNLTARGLESINLRYFDQLYEYYNSAVKEAEMTYQKYTLLN